MEGGKVEVNKMNARKIDKIIEAEKDSSSVESLTSWKGCLPDYFKKHNFPKYIENLYQDIYRFPSRFTLLLHESLGALLDWDQDASLLHKDIVNGIAYTISNTKFIPSRGDKTDIDFNMFAPAEPFYKKIERNLGIFMLRKNSLLVKPWEEEGNNKEIWMPWGEAIYGVKLDSYLGGYMWGRLINIGFGPEGDNKDHQRFIPKRLEEGILTYLCRKTDKWGKKLDTAEPYIKRVNLKGLFK